MLIEVPSGRDGNVIVPSPQTPPIKEHCGQQLSRAPRKICRAHLRHREYLVDVWISYQQRPISVLHHHRATRVREGALEFPEERGRHHYIAQRIETEDDDGQPTPAGQSGFRPLTETRTPEPRQERWHTDRQEKRW